MKLTLIMCLTIFALASHAAPRCWFDEQPIVPGKQTLVDGSFIFAAVYPYELAAEAVELIEDELKIDSFFEDIKVLTASAKQLKGESREQMKERVTTLLDQLLSNFPGLDVSCNWINHPMPGTTGHTIR